MIEIRHNAKGTAEEHFQLWDVELARCIGEVHGEADAAWIAALWNERPDDAWTDEDFDRESLDDAAAARSDGAWDAANEKTLRAQIADEPIPFIVSVSACVICSAKVCHVCGHLLPEPWDDRRAPCHACGATTGVRSDGGQDD